MRWPSGRAATLTRALERRDDAERIWSGLGAVGAQDRLRAVSPFLRTMSRSSTDGSAPRCSALGEVGDVLGDDPHLDRC